MNSDPQSAYHESTPKFFCKGCNLRISLTEYEKCKKCHTCESEKNNVRKK